MARMQGFLIKTAKVLKEKGFLRLSMWFLERAKKIDGKEVEKLLEEQKHEYASYLEKKAKEYEKNGDFTEALLLLERVKDLGKEVDEEWMERVREESRKQKEFETKLLLNPSSMGFQFANQYRKWLFSLTGTPRHSSEDDSSRKVVPPEIFKVWKEAYKNPEDYEKQYKLALNFSVYGYIWEAILQAEKTEKLKKTPEIEFLLGILYMDTGEKEKAAEKFTCAIELDPEYQEAYYYLGRLFSEIDDEIAIQYLRKCIEIDPTSDIAESAIEILGGIKETIEV
ncbi:MAG: tetratricopeptide repeat protein [Candidatus Aminicenantes bacterium]|nr:tetratricopeptide repeat protein [Candidatus Aminicenantes bacterium]